LERKHFGRIGQENLSKIAALSIRKNICENYLFDVIFFAGKTGWTLPRVPNYSSKRENRGRVLTRWV
jgi:hypothetical protein